MSFIVLCVGAIAFLVRVLVALVNELLHPVPRRVESYLVRYQPRQSRTDLVVVHTNVFKSRFSATAGERIILGVLASFALVVPLRGQSIISGSSANTVEALGTPSDPRVPPAVIQELEAMKRRIEELEAQLGHENRTVGADGRSDSVALPITGESAKGDSTDASLSSQQPPNAAALVPTDAEDRKTLDFLHGTTLNLGLDTYYGYNFNNPVGGVNLLRAYDVLSNQFSLNQASVVLERAPDVGAGRRWGARLDLQFGQASETAQGNPANEPRPDIYRNIFQAYGTYVFAVGKGINLDFGKWASSLGIEGNYTKDQINYSRAYWFNFLPFYHMGARLAIPLSERFTVNYWIVNGMNQVEATNGFKDQLFGFTAKPHNGVTWTMNYYLGQEHPDRSVSECGPIPVQPGLCFAEITPAPNGRTHIFDSYVSWQATPKLLFALEGDYLIQRLWANAAPGQSSAPAHTDGGAAYVQYQLTPKVAIGSRAEYMSDRGGLFSGISQALKENTVTFDYKVGDGLLMRFEWRRDFSNQPTFLSDVQGVLKKDQNTATLGLVWWWGRKEGSW
ncbi:MAG TPA: porin [Candidatus Binatia bacterium]|nr:porin [Candidatus Binatia bacterium]